MTKIQLENNVASIYAMYMEIYNREGETEAERWCDENLTSGEYMALGVYKIAQERKIKNQNWHVQEFAHL